MEGACEQFSGALVFVGAEEAEGAVAVFDEAADAFEDVTGGDGDEVGGVDDVDTGGDEELAAASVIEGKVTGEADGGIDGGASSRGTVVELKMNWLERMRGPSRAEILGALPRLMVSKVMVPVPSALSAPMPRVGL